MSKPTKTTKEMPPATANPRLDEPALDPEVVRFRAQFDERSPLDDLVRQGA
jgi:hypothetical protein